MLTKRPADDDSSATASPPAKLSRLGVGGLADSASEIPTTSSLPVPDPPDDEFDNLFGDTLGLLGLVKGDFDKDFFLYKPAVAFADALRTCFRSSSSRVNQNREIDLTKGRAHMSANIIKLLNEAPRFGNLSDPPPYPINTPVH